MMVLVLVLSYIIDNVGVILLCLVVFCSLFVAIDLFKDRNKYKKINSNNIPENNLNSDDDFISSLRSKIQTLIPLNPEDNTKIKSSDKLDYIKERLIVMDGRIFEEFCVILFEKTGEYESVDLTPYECDGGKDIVLTTKLNSEKIYVECKRLTPKATSTEDFMVGRPICQKFIGAMYADGIHKGIIITTGNVHDNAREYIKKLELNNDNIKLNIIELGEILDMCNNFSENELSDIFKIDFSSDEDLSYI